MSAPTGDKAMRAKPSLAFASVLISAVAALSVPADAACKKFGFTVNDYGKEGPTNDAKNLLDKHIAEWAAQNGVTDYQTGKKNVSCELFLDVVLFDEHTCTASATVCWGPDAKKVAPQSAATGEQGAAGTPPAPISKAEAIGQARQKAAVATPPPATTEEEAPAADTAAADADAVGADVTNRFGAAPTPPVEKVAAPIEDMKPTAVETPAAATPAAAAPSTPSLQTTAPVTPAGSAMTGAGVETGALQAGQGLAPQAQKRAGAISEKDRAAAAAAAASAAAAAERAAMAAETAANAAKEAAAAAVAASAASKGGATVPPLDHASGAKPAHTE